MATHFCTLFASVHVKKAVKLNPIDKETKKLNSKREGRTIKAKFFLRKIETKKGGKKVES